MGAVILADAAPAAAAPVTATFSGTVDAAFIFKPSSGDFDDSLSGQDFTLRFTYDPDTVGAGRVTGSEDDQIYGGSSYLVPDPVLSAVLTIGSFVYDFDGGYQSYAYTQKGADGLQSGQVDYLARDVVYENGFYRYSEISVFVYSLLHGGAYPHLLGQQVDIQPDPLDDIHTAAFSINECFYIGSPCDQIDDQHYSYVYGALTITRFQVGDARPSAVPLPAALPLLCSALAGLALFGKGKPKPGIAA